MHVKYTGMDIGRKNVRDLIDFGRIFMHFQAFITGSYSSEGVFNPETPKYTHEYIKLIYGVEGTSAVVILSSD